jgi:predicted lactoylglutathione lyase
MDTQIFVNLPVKNLQKSMDFCSKLGYPFNPKFTDKNAACLVIINTIYAMLLVEDFFKSFTKKEIMDIRKALEVIIAISAESRLEVDQLIKKPWQLEQLVPNRQSSTR